MIFVKSKYFPIYILLLLTVVFGGGCSGEGKRRSAMNAILETSREYTEKLSGDDSAIMFIDSLMSAMECQDSVFNKAVFNLCRNYLAKGRQADAYEYLRAIERVAKAHNYKGNEEFQLYLYLLSGASANEIGMSNLALEHYLEGLELAKKTGNIKFQAFFLNNIGVSYFHIADYDHTLDYFSQSLEINKQQGDRRNILLNYNNLMEVAQLRDDIEGAMTYALLAIQSIDEVEDADLFFVMQSMLGDIYRKKCNFDMASSYLTNAMNNQRKLGHDSDLFDTYMFMSNLSIDMQRQDSARYYADLAYGLTDSLSNPLLVSRALEKQAEIEELVGNYELGNKLIRRSYSLRDSMRLEEDRNRMVQSCRIFDIEKQESDDTRYRVSPWLLLFVGVVAAIAVALLCIKLSRARKRLSDAGVVEAGLRGQLDACNRRLTKYSLREVKEEEGIEAISSSLRSVLLGLNTRDKVNRDRIKELLGKLDQFERTEEGSDFRYYFEQVHPSFYKRLLEAYPDLTEKEQRLCAFLALGLSTKDIANITFREVRSVESQRNRLRKKIGLETDDNLMEWCKSFC